MKHNTEAKLLMTPLSDLEEMGPSSVSQTARGCWAPQATPGGTGEGAGFGICHGPWVLPQLGSFLIQEPPSL